MKKLLFLLFLLPVVLSLSISSVSSDKPIYDVGELGILAVTVDLTPPLAPGENFIRYGGASLRVSGPILSADVSLGSLSGTTLTLTLPFRTEKEGIYPHTLTFRAILYYEKNGKEESKLVEVSTLYPIRVSRSPTLWVENLSEEVVKNISLSLCSDVPLSDVEVSLSLPTLPSVVSLPSLEGCQPLSFTLLPNDMPEGELSLSVNVSYRGPIGEERSRAIPISIFYRKYPRHLSLAFPQPLEPYREGRYRITIASSQPLENLKVYFPSNLTLVGEPYLFVGRLEGREELEPLLIPSLPTGSYLLPFRVEWGKERVESYILYVPVVVIEKPKVGVDGVMPKEMGENATLTLYVVNGGRDKIYNVRLSLETHNVALMEVDGERYLGSIEGDDFATESFLLANPKGNFSVNVTVTFEDAFGNPYKVVETFYGVRRAERQEVWPYLLLLALGGGLVWWKLRSSSR